MRQSVSLSLVYQWERNSFCKFVFITNAVEFAGYLNLLSIDRNQPIWPRYSEDIIWQKYNKPLDLFDIFTFYFLCLDTHISRGGYLLRHVPIWHLTSSFYLHELIININNSDKLCHNMVYWFIIKSLHFLKISSSYLESLSFSNHFF